MRRVLVLNNYSLQRVLGEVNRGEKPAHHLYGIDKFELYGFHVEISPFNEQKSSVPKVLAKIGQLIPPLGDLRQQADALCRRHIDLIYAPCQTQTQCLSYLRAMGLLRTPIVTLAHHPIDRSRWPWMKPFLRMQLHGTDSFPSLSRVVANGIRELASQRSISSSVNWGPDLNFYPMPTEDFGFGAIAAGRTGRDFLTFGLAATSAQVAAKILCLRNDYQNRFQEFGEKVCVTAVNKESDLNYKGLMPMMSVARVHAIPLFKGFSLAGLTSLTDAMALGKPVIMTRNPYIDIDIEAEGIGHWVDPGDVTGWVKSLQWFDHNPEEALLMGKRARLLAEERFNSDIFARQIIGMFEEVLRTN
jgi:hypothetical protein